MNHKEHTVRNLVQQGRHDINSSSGGTPELAQQLETLVSNWGNLQKKVDTKVAFYGDIYTLHEELKSKTIEEMSSYSSNDGVLCVCVYRYPPSRKCLA